MIINILLTGASGFLGHYLKNSLSNIGELDTLGRSENNNIICDIGSEIQELEGKYQLIVHAAGKAHQIPKTKKEENEFWNINYKGTIKLTKALEKNKKSIKAFVFISTVAVYGRNYGELITEQSKLLAYNPYGSSKIKAEQYLQKWCSDNNIILTILRLPLLIGENPPGNLGDMINAIKNSRYALIGQGEARRSMVLASDVADFIPLIFNVGGIYNLTDSYHPTYSELSHQIAFQFGKRKIYKIPMFYAKILAKIGDVIGFLRKKDFPINSLRLDKMTRSLTFSDEKARLNGWNPKPILKHVKL